MTRGILGTTVRFGSRRIDHTAEPGPPGLDARRVADADEDLVTLTIGALREHLAKNGRDGADIGALFLVGRFDGAATETIVTALGRPDLFVSQYADTPMAAMDAVLAAHGRAGDKTTYVVAADDGRGPGTDADRGAAAALVAVGEGAAVHLLQQTHHRAAAHTTSAHAARVLEALGGPTGDTVWLAPVLQRPSDARRVVPKATKAGKVMPLVHEVGALGCAAPFLSLAHGLDVRGTGDELVWWMADAHGAIGARFSSGPTPDGSGVVEAISGPALPITTDAAVRARDAWTSGGLSAQGAFVSMQSYLGQAAARYRWVGQRCTACAHVTFPPRECCPECGAAESEAQPLAGTGTVYARTTIGTGGAPTEFAPLQHATGPYEVVIVELTEGPRVAAMCTATNRPLSIGDPVRFELRLLYVQDGTPRYGFKAVRT